MLWGKKNYDQREDVKKLGTEEGNDWFNYSDSLSVPHWEPMINAKLMFNGEERFEALNSKYFTIQLTKYLFQDRRVICFIQAP